MFGSITCLREFSGRAGFIPILYITLPLRGPRPIACPCRFGVFHIIGPVFSPEMITGYFNFAAHRFSRIPDPFYIYPSITLPLFSFQGVLTSQALVWQLGLCITCYRNGTALLGNVCSLQSQSASYSLGSHLAIMFGSITCLREFSGRADSSLYITLPLRGPRPIACPCRFGVFHIIGPVFSPEMITGYFNFAAHRFSWVFLTLLYLPQHNLTSFLFLGVLTSQALVWQLGLCITCYRNGTALLGNVCSLQSQSASYSLGSHLAIMFGSITCLREFSGRAGFIPIYYPSTSRPTAHSLPLSFRGFPYYWTRLFTRNDNRIFQLRGPSILPYS